MAISEAQRCPACFGTMTAVINPRNGKPEASYECKNCGKKLYDSLFEKFRGYTRNAPAWQEGNHERMQSLALVAIAAALTDIAAQLTILTDLAKEAEEPGT